MNGTKLLINAGEKMIPTRGGTSQGRRVTREVTGAGENKRVSKSLGSSSGRKERHNGIVEDSIKIKGIKERVDATSQGRKEKDLFPGFNERGGRKREIQKCSQRQENVVVRTVNRTMTEVKMNGGFLAKTSERH